MDEHSVEIPKYSFVEAIKSGFINFSNFKGRSSRSAFWYFLAGLYGISCCVGLVAEALGAQWMYMTSYALMLPSISAHIRRLHDVNKSGWNYLWYLTGIGLLYVVYLLVKPSAAANKYGEYPILPGEQGGMIKDD